MFLTLLDVMPRLMYEMFSGHLFAPFFLGPSGNNHPSHLLCISPESPPLNFYKAEHGGGLFITARAIGETFRQMNRQTNKVPTLSLDPL